MSHGDVERLTRIVNECAAALVLYARQWLDRASAEDAVQEALVSLLSQRRPPENPTAWMYRAVRNAAIDAARSAARRRLSLEDREVVVLRIWGDLGFAEIADVLQLSVSTAHDRYRAALGQLRRELSEPCKIKNN